MNSVKTAATCSLTSLALAMAAILMVGCNNESPSDAPTGGDAYEARGIIRQLPGETAEPTMPAYELRIEHEAIPEFVGETGEVVGMDSMTMPFRLAEDVSVEGLSVGDKVRFTFMWDWEELNNTVTQIEKLPDDTELNLGAEAEPASEAEDHTDHDHADHDEADQGHSDHDHSEHDHAH